MKLKHIPELDGLRAIAAIMVMVFHFVPNNIPLTDSHFVTMLQNFMVFGQTGVDLFFVLSGFLITRILIINRNESNYFSNFYIRRSLRIFPLYYFFLLITFFLIPFITNSKIEFTHFLWYGIYAQNVITTLNIDLSGPGHFWSLAVEEHFYLLWPLVVYLSSNKLLKNISIFIILFSILLRYIFLSNDIGVFYFTFTRLDALAFGTLLAYFESTNQLEFVYRKVTYLFIPIVSLLIIVWFSISGEGNIYIQIFKFTFIGFVYFVIHLILISENSIIGKHTNKLFGSEFLTHLGKISYGLYVYHPLCFGIVKHFIEPKGYYFFFSMLFSMLLTYLVANLSYKYFESYFLELKSKFTKSST